MPLRRPSRTSPSRPQLPKLVPPRLPHTLKRAQLVEDIVSSEAPAVWLEAGPGSGKTTLASLIATAHPSEAVWIQLDSGDRDPGNFFHYLHAAFAAAFPRAARAFPRHDGTATDWTAFARHFSRSVYSALKRPMLLVLDNFQEVSGSPVERLAAVLIEELPDTHRILFASWEPPGEPFARLLVQRKLERFGWHRLRLSMQECAELWQKLAPDRAQEAQEIARLTEGWASGLVLLSMAPMDRTMAPSHTMRTAFYSYFADQVFDRLPQETQAAVKSCAYFDRFTLPMAAKMTQNPEIETVIRQAAQRSLFISRHHHAGQEWFQFHGLFRDFLTARTHGDTTPDDVCRHRLHAADILQASGQDVEAIRLYVAAGETHRAAVGVAALAPRLLGEGRHVLLGELLGSLPEDGGGIGGWRAFWRGIVSPIAETSARLEHFAVARAAFDEAGDAHGAFMAVCGRLFVAYTARKSAQDMTLCDERFLDYLPHWLDSPLQEEPTLELIAVAGVAAGTLWSERVKPPQERLLQRVLAILDRADRARDRGLVLNVAAIILNVLEAWRQTPQGLGLLPTFDRLAAHGEVTERDRALWSLAAGFFLYNAAYQLARNELLDEAEKYARRALECAGQQTCGHLLFDVHRLFTDLAWRRNRLDEAAVSLDAMRALLDVQEPTQQASWHIRATLMAMVTDKPEAALVEATAALRIVSAQDLSDRSLAYPTHLQAAALFRIGRFDQAYSTAEAAIAAALPGHAMVYRLALECWKTSRSLDSGADDTDDRLRMLFAQLRQKQIYVIGIIFRDIMRRLCTAALQREIEVDFVREMVRRMELKPWGAAPAHWPWPIHVHLLGELRIEIDSQTIAFEGKMPRKPLELLAYLAGTATQPGRAEYRWTSFDRLLADLWPDQEAADPRKSLEMAIHRLRKLLRHEEAVLVRGSEAKLNPDLVGSDVRTLMALCIDGAAMPPFPQAADCARRIAQCAPGAFLPKEKAPWSAIVRERVTAALVTAIQDMGESLERQGQWQDALALYRQGLAIDQLIEPFYRGAIRCALQLGDHAEGMRFYRRCRELLSIVLSVPPSAETEALKERLLAAA